MRRRDFPASSAPALAYPPVLLGASAEGYPQEWYRTAVWGRPTPFTPEPMAEETAIDGGEGVGGVTLVRVWTPGHCPDHHVMFCPERKWLFAGDLFVSARPRLFRMEEVSLLGVVILAFNYALCVWLVLRLWCSFTLALRFCVRHRRTLTTRLRRWSACCSWTLSMFSAHTRASSLMGA